MYNAAAENTAVLSSIFVRKELVGDLYRPRISSLNLQISAIRLCGFWQRKHTKKPTTIKIGTVTDSQRLTSLPVYNLSIILCWTWDFLGHDWRQVQINLHTDGRQTPHTVPEHTGSFYLRSEYCLTLLPQLQKCLRSCVHVHYAHLYRVWSPLSLR